MKQAVLIVGLLCMGMGAGYLLASADVVERTAGRSDTVEVSDLRRERFEDRQKINELEAELERLRRLLAAANKVTPPYPDDTPEAVETLLKEAYAENNVDWLIEVIDRLLAMGEKGYPLLRKLIMDLAFKSKFLPAQSDFRVDQIYKVGRIFANREKKFIGFIDFLLVDPGTNNLVKQFAMMAGAFYVGSNAPGSEELSQTLMQQFMQTQGAAGQMAGMMPGNMGKKMQIFAMMMSGNKEMIGPLRDELKNTKNPGDQADILGALAYLGDESTVPLIRERLDPAQGDSRKLLRALGRVGTDEAHETASDFLRAIPDSKRFYRHVGTYVRNGGGDSAVMLIRDRVQANPNDPEVRNTIGTLRRFPTQQSLDTLNLIASTNTDSRIQKRATDAAADVGKRLRGELPE